jgi:hypothetical protein
MKKKQPPEEIKKQVEQIEYLAKRLPWIAAFVTLLFMLFTLIEVFLRS